MMLGAFVFVILAGLFVGVTLLFVVWTLIQIGRGLR